ncbi:hypothetical protein T440DRAFT_396350 [Plenodomus tracheiphilus IPT5]|uniref:Uncharacterized protein n=1 Tax=Plenodomus tracheiphilus IPT5 TaxID=1408161 RepID=A0A6A7B5E1_9PLEO|nr:hypothetical protein T440DRAFT_396350 [Plenodomus tracheiphilus IPT5]
MRPRCSIVVHVKEGADIVTGAKALSERRLPPTAQPSNASLQQSMRRIYALWRRVQRPGARERRVWAQTGRGRCCGRTMVVVFKG